MESEFWHQKWEKNEIGFHRSGANPLLVSYFARLSLAPGSRVFLPLCGKTLDISWLVSNGYRVAGAELSQLAVDQFFMDLGIKPRTSVAGGLRLHSAENIDIFVGDIFDLSGALLGPVDAIYDRAALVALPEPMRQRYTQHLMDITLTAPQLLVCYEYDQTLKAGPPFSVSRVEVKRYYEDRYALTLLYSAAVAGGLNGKYAAMEDLWLLERKAAPVK